MSKKDELKLVENTEETKQPSLKDLTANSYWNTCGAHQSQFPCQVCRNEDKTGDNWSVNSKKHNNCFWDWVRNRTFPDGFMNPLSQAETAKMLGCSPTSIHMIEKAAIEKLKKGPYIDILRDYLTPEPSGDNPSDYLVTIPIGHLEAELDDSGED